MLCVTETMILRRLSKSNGCGPEEGEVRPAAPVFIESQKHIEPPYAVFFQAEHSRIAGELAKALREEIFGDLSPEVIEATGQHDFGWQESDEQQIRSLPGQLRPFPALSVEETLPSWRESVAHAGSVGPLVEVLVSRHFCLLGAGDPGRADFVRCENERREAIERVLPFEAADLDRWTGAVGFCDLVSLYLCSGCEAEVEFPLAHPASPAAAQAPKTTLRWKDGSPAFSSPVFKPGAQISMTSRSYNGQGTDLPAQRFSWTFSEG